MKLIIDIPEEKYKHIQEEQWLPNRLLIEKAIANGTPLDSVLDKIRAEIEQDAFKDVNGSKFISVNRVNQIIDKYREEQE